MPSKTTIRDLMPDLEAVAASDEGLEELPSFDTIEEATEALRAEVAAQHDQRANGGGSPDTFTVSSGRNSEGFVVRPSEMCVGTAPWGARCTLKEFHPGVHSWDHSERADDMPMGEASMLPGMPEPAEPVIPEPEPTDYDIPFEAQFARKDFKSAPGIKAIAERHIALTDAFSHLRDVEIRYFWKRRGGLKGGNPRYGALTRPTGLAAYALGQPVYALWLAADHCRDGHWTEPQFEAQIFDLLAHSAVDPDDHSAYRIVGDDFAGMRLTLQKFGLWQADLKAMAADLRQLPIADAFEPDFMDGGETVRMLAGDADSFDSADGQTHSYGDGCNPPHVVPDGGAWADLQAHTEAIDGDQVA